jgi:hypothetical protein
LKVLITSATLAMAHKLKTKLANDAVLLGDYADLPAFMRKNIIKLPNPAADTYTHEMLKICLDNDVEVLYPLTNNEMDILLISEQLFKEYNINVIDGRNEL